MQSNSNDSGFNATASHQNASVDHPEEPSILNPDDDVQSERQALPIWRLKFRMLLGLYMIYIAIWQMTIPPEFYVVGLVAKLPLLDLGLQLIVADAPVVDGWVGIDRDEWRALFLVILDVWYDHVLNENVFK
ncbi:hypothetical protein K491DRAFT_719326 [Lophiostoma macrostomum CBS 122681]|uniref:Uncharacterized protein n=1 Tax=Lophiostoma macrostomum CBS 122681 TaxID=1314788 RepID=A0A6A6SZG1_9PLEO|nr:hypothetical protein K491DRAFT_719326 [Lophiostoma macrostomum CBS 122681]